MLADDAAEDTKAGRGLTETLLPSAQVVESEGGYTTSDDDLGSLSRTGTRQYTKKQPRRTGFFRAETEAHWNSVLMLPAAQEEEALPRSVSPPGKGLHLRHRSAINILSQISSHHGP